MVGPTNLNFVSHSKKTLKEGIEYLGGNVSQLNQAKREKGEWKAFLELHIEQGGILHSKKEDIGVVTAIVGINYWRVVVLGTPNHSGTTPMNQRKDALLAVKKKIIYYLLFIILF